jgi:glycine cleavage system H protein
MVYVELPELGQDLEVGGEMAVVESVKAASDVYAPVSGKVIAVNEDLTDDSEKINADPYGDGWIVRLQPTDGLDGETMTPDEYQALLDELES